MAFSCDIKQTKSLDKEDLITCGCCWRSAGALLVLVLCSMIAFSSTFPSLQFSCRQFVSLTLPCSFSIISPPLHRCSLKYFFSLSEQQPRVSITPSPVILVRETMQAELLGSRQTRLGAPGRTWMVKGRTYLVPGHPSSQDLSSRLTLVQVRHWLTPQATGRRRSRRLATVARLKGNIATACLQLASPSNWRRLG